VTMDPATQRQQVLFLYLEHSGLDGRVADLDGSRPYRTGTDALRDGWRLLQASPVPQRIPGAERVAGRLEHELLLERIVDA
jgi:hypothetical protein